MSEKLKRCAIYIRVSTAEQAMYGKSLQAQREYLETYAADHDMVVVGIYADEGQTARKELKKRKAIHALLASVKRGEIDTIIFWKMDRWFRSVADFYKVQEILDAHQVTWIATAEPNINMDTRDGRLNLNIMLSIGQNEVDTTSERIKFTVDNMIRNKRLVWGEANMPLGYKIGEVDGQKKMVKDEDTAPIVEEFFRYFMKYQKKKQTVIHIQDTFGIDFSYTQLRTMLSSEFYIGKYRGSDYCPAYLTEEEWAKIQSISQNNIKSTRSGRIYLFTGLMRCPLCGQKLVGTGCASIINRKTGEKRTYCYYRCNRALIDHICTYTHRMSQNLLEDYLLANLEREYEKFLIRSEIQAEKVKMKQGARTASKIKDELSRLNLLFQKGRVSFDYYETEYEKLENELKELTVVQITPVKKAQSAKTMFEQDFRAMYNTLTQEKRQAYWRNMITEIHLTIDNQVDYVDFF